MCEVTQELDTASDSLAETSRERRELAEKQMAIEKEMVIKKGIELILTCKFWLKKKKKKILASR